MTAIKIIKYLILIFLTLFFEANVNFLFSIKNTTPDLLLVLVVILSLKEDRIPALLLGFFAGLLQDAVTTQFFGLYALSKLMTVFIGSYFQEAKRTYNLVYFATTALALIFIHELIFQFFYSFGLQVGFFKLFFFYVLPPTVYTFVIAVMAFLLFSKKLWQSRAAIGS